MFEDEDEDFLPSHLSLKKKIPKIAVPLPTFKTPASVPNKVSGLGTTKTSKFCLLPELVPPPRTLTLGKESSPNIEFSSLLALQKMLVADEFVLEGKTTGKK
jgi:hypothetical protein